MAYTGHIGNIFGCQKRSKEKDREPTVCESNIQCVLLFSNAFRKTCITQRLTFNHIISDKLRPENSIAVHCFCSRCLSFQYFTVHCFSVDMEFCPKKIFVSYGHTFFFSTENRFCYIFVSL